MGAIISFFVDIVKLLIGGSIALFIVLFVVCLIISIPIAVIKYFFESIGNILTGRDVGTGFAGILVSGGLMYAIVKFGGPPLMRIGEYIVGLCASISDSWFGSLLSGIVGLLWRGKLYILAFIGICLVISCVSSLLRRLRLSKTVRGLRKRGIDKIDLTSEEKSELRKFGSVTLTEDGCLISTLFYEDLVPRISGEDHMTTDMLKAYCFQNAEQFQTAYLSSLLAHLCSDRKLISMAGNDGEASYLSVPFVERCETLLEGKGAATRQELIQLYETSPVTRALCQDAGPLADLVLNRMLSDGAVDKVKLDKGRGDLYVVKNPPTDCEMTRRVVEL